MKRERPKQQLDVQQRVQAQATEQGGAILLIEELEARLTPDGPFGSSHNSQPPGGQVGWGC
jgi:hypothetical protein